MISYQYHDGGRSLAGYKGETGDCATRAIAIAASMDYQQAYDLVNQFGAIERKSKRRSRKSNARLGIYTPTMHRIMESLGASWTPTMQIGSGYTVHVRSDELPETGRLILNLSKHFAAYVNGVLYDNHDSSRDGTRCVYGYWTLPE